MGWQILEHWGPDARRLERLTGGVANDIWRVLIRGRVAVARLNPTSRTILSAKTYDIALILF